ncbi:hypothetical protein BOV90_04050 [Solemya velum gill symbiont]|uniref:Uncharacterized protein n=1 Tax=Solemya velum gill symbiont TaxID=2340 RepID=A0A1T2D009_SOVGS|nr:hypothetical protein [Solemya velum gill symbiont]OOY35519.1 hypothetical protein BOV88_04570 [Solemya velum gill symbiont]OOY38526.1 hypothetical protein BOV89_01605 [Solemya velum gill symbiont]OOY40479.1 hypothetical protein BOV90_04050 [Solemya velum gill symbiont]OOY42388.1 hypothetical protein BOV91_07130 [Solemya velum gill symbiont]OOY45096.1 hypothetical protein BOV92_06705 [Solemya velum gill symbiont]
MKPSTTTVMHYIIRQVKDSFPFALDEQTLCADECRYGCPKKLLEFIDIEITEWEGRLHNGETPNFRDIEKLTRASKKIHRVLEKNNLVSR